MILNYNGYLFITSTVFQSTIKKKSCIINCDLGFNNQKEEGQLLINFINDNDNRRNMKKSIIKKKIDKSFDSNQDILVDIKKKKAKNRKALIDVNQIVNLFSTMNCSGEDDWNEWFKSSSKILFEQSPSYALFYCHYV